MKMAGVLVLILSSFACKQSPKPPEHVRADPAPTPAVPAKKPTPVIQTAVEIHSVVLVEDAAAIRVRWLRGRMSPTRESGVVSFDDQESYVIDVDAGAVGVSADDLTKLLNTTVFAGSKAPLRDVKVTMRGPQIQLNGKLHKAIAIPVELVGDVGIAPDGRIRVHAAKLQALHVPVKGIFGALGIKLADLIDVKQTKGIEMAGNDILLSPAALLPPPHTRGRLSDAHIYGNDLVLFYGNARHEVAATRPRKNYLSFQGGTIRFGKLTMRDADLVMMDSGSDPWFYFNIHHYQEQVTHGTAQLNDHSGLVISMPDYNRLHQQKATPRATTPRPSAS